MDTCHSAQKIAALSQMRYTLVGSLEHFFIFSIILGTIIPFDFHFFTGVETQPPTSTKLDYPQQKIMIFQAIMRQSMGFFGDLAAPQALHSPCGWPRG